MTETQTVTGRTPAPWYKKINPAWWLVGGDGWNVPEYNNNDPVTGKPMPYLPDVKNIWLRRFYWFICRNPLMNFVGSVIGYDGDYTVKGSAPVMRVTGRDCTPQQIGFRFSVITAGVSWGWLALGLLALYGYLFVNLLLLPSVVFCLVRGSGFLPYYSYFGGVVEHYFGWRPNSGAFGIKLVFAAHPASQM